jgi:phage shock protein C
MKTMSAYALDKRNAKALGVCAGLARTTGRDPTLVRIGAVALTQILRGPVMILFYVLVGAFTPAR